MAAACLERAGVQQCRRLPSSARGCTCSARRKLEPWWVLPNVWTAMDCCAVCVGGRGVVGCIAALPACPSPTSRHINSPRPPPPSPHLQVCFITNPIWVVKTRLMLQRRTAEQAAAGLGAAQAGPAAGAAAAAAAASGASIPRQLLGGVAGGAGGGGAAEVAAAACAVEYRGFLHAFVQIARCEGLRGLYKGLLPSLLLVSERDRGGSGSGDDHSHAVPGALCSPPAAYDCTMSTLYCCPGDNLPAGVPRGHSVCGL